MASLVLGAVGAAAGFMVGGPTGAKIGWMIGSTLGGIMDQPDVHSEGPRVGDRQVTSSTLGTPMTLLYGTQRIGGNIIHCSEIREVSKTEHAGKGGPDVSSTTYSYNADVAIDLCQGVVAGIRKIWSDGKLIYDISAGSTAASVIASSAHAQTFKLYTGTETQLPDPTLEALAGVGNVPAYRGRAYVVFGAMDCPSGRIPQMTFEVVSGGAKTSNVIVSTISVSRPYFADASPRGDVACVLSFQTATLSFFDIASGVLLGDLGGISAAQGLSVNGRGDLAYACAGSKIYEVGLYTRLIQRSFTLAESVAANCFRVNRAQNKAYVATTAGNLLIIDLNSLALTQTIALGLTDIRGLDINASGAMAVVTDYGAKKIMSIDLVNGTVGAAYGLTLTPYRVALANSGLAYVVNNLNNSLTVFNLNTGVELVTVAVGNTPVDVVINPSGSAVYVAATNIYVFDIGSNAFVATIPISNGAPLTISINASGTYAYAANDAYNVAYAIRMTDALTLSPPTLASIITDQCARAGLSAGKIDVSGLTDTVPGYAIARASSARANIEPLLKAYFVDPVEVDGKLKFVKRANQVQAASITFDDLAAAENAGQPGDPFPLVRTQESDLPRSVTVQFMDLNADYQPSAEQAIRQVTGSINDLSEDLPISTISNHAKQVADVLMFDAWSARNKRSGKLTRQYANLTPGDIVAVEYPRGTTQSRLLTRVNDTGAMIEFEALDANAELYQTAPIGSTPGSGQTVDALPAPSQMVLLDIPILRDRDDNAGLYVAQAGVSTPWRGAALYIGIDDASLLFRGDVSVSAPIGLAETALGDWQSGVIDESNTLVVNIGPDTLSSSTRNKVVGGTDNVCALGKNGRWEILQFIRAASLGSGRYRISGLKRGQRGTEANRGNHAASDTFVLLTPLGLLRPSFDIADLSKNRNFRSITKGLQLSSSSSTVAQNTGVGLKPLAPIDLRGSRASNDLTLTWGRRTRLSDNWLAGTVPLGETSESYSIDIFSDGTYATVKRTLTSSTPTVTYTSAQQVADFGSNQATVYARVYQVSSTLGRGFYLQGSQ